MPEHASQDILINAPEGFVLEAILELDAYPQWIPEVQKVEVFQRDDRGRATRATTTTIAMGNTLVHDYVYDYSAYPHVISWNLVSGNMVSMLHGQYEIVSDSDTSAEVTYTLDVELTAPMPGFVKKKAARKIVSAALENLKAYSESLYSP